MAAVRLMGLYKMVGGSTDSGTRQRIDTSLRNFALRNSGVLRKEKAKDSNQKIKKGIFPNQVYQL